MNDNAKHKSKLLFVPLLFLLFFERYSILGLLLLLILFLLLLLLFDALNGYNLEGKNKKE